MTRKGITPIIAIVVLLLIVVALSSLAYSYISGIASGQIEGSFLIQIGSEACTLIANTGNASVFNVTQVSFIIKNTGVTSSITLDDFLVRTITNTTGGAYTLTSADFSVEPIPAQGVSIVTTKCNDNFDNGCGTGLQTFRMSTGVTTSPPRTVTC